jgi:hypothetical protein
MKRYILLLLFFVISTIAKSQPVITSFSPAKAVQGSVLTINGSGFNANTTNNIVYLGAAKATVTAASSTQLTVTVPYGSSYAPISVLNTSNNLWGCSGSYFLPVSKNATPTITSSTFSVTSFANSPGAGSYDQMLIADINQDGKVDIISTIASASDAIITFWKNTSTLGNISFSNVQQLTIPIGSSNKLCGIAIGDLNADGYLDIVETHLPSTISYVSYFLNNGASASAGSNNQFSSINTITISASGFWSNEIAIADFNKDGLNDIVVGGRGSSSFYGMVVLKNNSSIANSPSFSELPTVTGRNDFRSLLTGDIDRDGEVDIASIGYYSSGKSIDIFRNQSTVTTISFSNSSGGYSSANLTTGRLADINGDGKLDVIACGISGAFYVHENTSSVGTVSLSSSGVSITRSAIAPIYSADSGDLNGDGKPDVVFTNYTNSTPGISIFQNTGNPGAITSSSLSSEINISISLGNGISVRIADFDNDGNNDFVFLNSNTSAGLRVYRNLSNGVPMPVTWQSFTAEKQGKASLLKWSTASEQNTKDFEVQHSTNTLSWTPLGTIPAAGNSTTTRQYSFTHATPFKGGVYNYYRILQRDLDGEFSYSKIASLIYDEPGSDVFVYPNPATGTVTIYLAESQEVRLINLAGATVWKGTLAAGRNQLPLTHLAKGIYWVLTETGKKQLLVQ